MARTVGCILVETTQTSNIFLRSQHTRYNETMQGNTFHLQTIKECLSNILQENSRMRHKIRNALMERVYMIEWIATDINQLTLAHFRILTVLYRRNAPSLGCYQLQVIGIRKSRQEVRHTQDAMRNNTPLQSYLLNRHIFHIRQSLFMQRASHTRECTAHQCKHNDYSSKDL